MVNRNNIRKMLLTDTPAVFAIEEQISVAPWSEQLFKDCINVGYDSWVLIEDKQVVGYGVLSYAVNEAHILQLAIAPEKQRQGLGEKLLHHLLDQAKIKGAEEAFLEVRESNLAARALYQKYNFVEVGIRKDYYEGLNGTREDGLSLTCSLY